VRVTPDADLGQMHEPGVATMLVDRIYPEPGGSVSSRATRAGVAGQRGGG
jgi:hypothetical protein